MSEFNEYLLAVEELDVMTLQGYFGEESKQLIMKRDSIEINDFLFECVKSIFESNQFGKKNIVDVTMLILNLFIDGIKINGQETVDVIMAFFKGTEENPELESMSSYGEFLRIHVEFKKLNNEMRYKRNITNMDKKKLGSKILSSYSKGVELVGKVFTHLLTIEQIINGKEYDLLKNSFLTIYIKTKEFTELCVGKYDELVSVIDRSIRNADSHLNTYYSVREGKYILKKVVYESGKKKNKTFKITPHKMLLEIYPKIGWFIQGFICAGALIVIGFNDREKFTEVFNYIKEFKKREQQILSAEG